MITSSCNYTPKFQIGDCIAINYHVSEFDEHIHYSKILKIGKEHYLLTIFGEDNIKDIDNYAVKVNCKEIFGHD